MSVELDTLPDAVSHPATLAESLARDGVVRLPPLVSADTLRDMQAAFASRLRYFNCNNVAGYERTEPNRLMVQDVLTLSQGFVDIALHPLVTAVLDEYLGTRYELCEAKGWQSQPTNQNFNAWHGDMWYDQTQVVGRIPREVKLAFYLTDVKSGAFQYIRGTHGQQAPRALKQPDVEHLPLDRMEEFLGSAGTPILFDTSGTHRQAVPILEPRRAVFLNYHDPDVPLQAEDVEYYRYHPLLLNAAFLGGLTPAHQRILGFGNQTHYQKNFLRQPAHPWTHAALARWHAARLHLDVWSGRVFGKLGRLLGRR